MSSQELLRHSLSVPVWGWGFARSGRVGGRHAGESAAAAGAGTRARHARVLRRVVQERLHHAARPAGDQHRSDHADPRRHRGRRLQGQVAASSIVVSVYGYVWNDLWSEQDHPTVGSWNEFDWAVGMTVKFAQNWKFGIEYVEFLSPPGNFTIERNIEFTLAYDDSQLVGHRRFRDQSLREAVLQRSPARRRSSSARPATPTTSKSASCRPST